MRQGARSPNHRRAARGVLVLLAFVAAGCVRSTETEYPAVSGQRVQGASVVARGAVPYRVGAYELVFPGETDQARRAALLVDLAGGQGHARGFVEWGRSGEVPLTYVAGGWARQRDVKGESVTVFELSLSALKAGDTQRVTSDSEHSTPIAVRVVVHEASGDVTLTRRH